MSWDPFLPSQAAGSHPTSAFLFRKLSSLGPVLDSSVQGHIFQLGTLTQAGSRLRSGLWRPCHWGWGDTSGTGSGQKTLFSAGRGWFSLCLFNILPVLEEGHWDPLPFTPVSKETLALWAEPLAGHRGGEEAK